MAREFSKNKRSAGPPKPKSKSRPGAKPAHAKPAPAKKFAPAKNASPKPPRHTSASQHSPVNETEAYLEKVFQEKSSKRKPGAGPSSASSKPKAGGRPAPVGKSGSAKGKARPFSSEPSPASSDRPRAKSKTWGMSSSASAASTASPGLNHSPVGKSRPAKGKAAPFSSEPSPASSDRPRAKSKTATGADSAPARKPKSSKKGPQQPDAAPTKSLGRSGARAGGHLGPKISPKPSSAKATSKRPTEKPGKEKLIVTVRLNKWIADSGHCSRREADRLIESGEVRVNGKVIQEMGYQIRPTADQVKIKGKLITVSPKNVTIMYHKPKGLLTTRKDEQGRKTIYDGLPEQYQTLDPAGRLDRDSTGLLILSTDGDLVYRLTHPKFHVPKVYRVRVDKAMTAKLLDKLSEGVFFEEEEKIAKADAIEWESPDTLKMVLSTGYNRQVRRMLEAVGREVLSLKRLSVGPIQLGHLAPGAARVLMPHEIRALYQAVGYKTGRPAKK